MMKKLFMMATCMTMVAIMLTGCSSKKPQNYKIELEENATTGYTWSYTIADESIIKLEKDETTAGDKDKAGAPGTHIYEFSGIKEGETTITFTYKRDWDGGETAETKQVTLIVDKDKNVQSK